MKYLHKICLAAVLMALVVLCGCSADDYTLPTQVDMQPGESVALAGLVRYTGPEEAQATAEDAAMIMEQLGSVDNISFSFASSAPGVVSVDEEGVMTAGLTGEATVIVNCAALDYYAEVRVSVRTVPQSLTVEPVAALTPGDSYTLNAEVRPGKKYAKLLYSAADESVATVDENGVITAVAAGETDVTVQVAGSSLTAVCRAVVTKEDEMMQGVTLSRGEAEMTAGETLLLSAKAYPESDTAVAWQSTDENVATVDESGVVMAVGAGAATVTATVDDKTAACAVTVTGSATGASATPETGDVQPEEEEAGIFTAERWGETAQSATDESAATPENETEAAPGTATPETVITEPATEETTAKTEPETAPAATVETATPESATETENAATPETATEDDMETIDLDVFYEQTPESATAGSAAHDEEDTEPQSNRGWPHLPNGMPLGPGPVIPQQTPETAAPAETPETAQPAEPEQDTALPTPQPPETATPETATPETATPESAWEAATDEAVDTVRDWVDKIVERILS